MAAGLGFKDFTTGEVLTAADVDGYLMQGVWVFASATARDAAVTSPQEGNFAYLKDTNVTTYYTGSAWANLDTTGMTNPMTTTGDTIYSSSGSTPARLGIGTAGQVLKVNSGATAPEWGTAASGALTLITSASPSAVSSQSINDCFTSTYRNYLVTANLTNSTNSGYNLRLRASGTDNTSSNYGWIGYYQYTGAATAALVTQSSGQPGVQNKFNAGSGDSGGENTHQIYFMSPEATAKTSYMARNTASFPLNNEVFYGQNAGIMTVTTAYDGFTLYVDSGNFTGTIRVYGIEN